VTADTARSRGGDSIAAYFKFAERGTNLATEIRAGVTTFMVMAYIIFLNPNILTAGFGTADPDFTVPALAAATALVAGVMTIAMGVVANYPFALAAGLGINAIVAFSLIGRGLTPAGAMGVIVLEGLIVTVLVLAGLREAIMNAVPLALKRSIGVGIGLFILFIGFANGGLIVAGGGTLVTPSYPTTPSQFVFLIGLVITIALWALKIRAALIISIVATTLIGLIPAALGQAPVTVIPADLTLAPSFSTLATCSPWRRWSRSWSSSLSC
jgi:AGZA family xanthine/uracil permease-like MFS transporter